jgi:CRP-like cAMP-binding protein
VALPEKIKKKTVVYHIATKQMPGDSGLSLAKFGIENTIYFDVPAPDYETAYVRLGLLKYLDFLHDTPMQKAQEFISILEEERFSRGDVIIRKNTFGDRFYIIYSGNVTIYSDDGELKKLFGPFDYFGEAALITGERRSADVHAETDVVAYSIRKDRFLSFIAGTDYELTLTHLVEIRDREAWQILSTSRFMRFFTSTQRSWLETMLTPLETGDSGVLIHEGAPVDSVYLLREGSVTVWKGGNTVAVLQKGDIVGNAIDVYQRRVSGYSFRHDRPLRLYRINAAHFFAFLKKNPGLVMKMNYMFRQYLFHA